MGVAARGTRRRSSRRRRGRCGRSSSAAFPEAVEQVDFGNKLLAVGLSMKMRDLVFAIIAPLGARQPPARRRRRPARSRRPDRGHRQADPARQGPLGRGGVVAGAARDRRRPGRRCAGERAPSPASRPRPGARAGSTCSGAADAGELVHRAAWSDGAWLEPESLGGTLASNPAATAWAVDQLEVFAVFPDGELWDRYWDGRAGTSGSRSAAS